ncbi:MAG TPA: hypothetical protein DGR97_04880 [Gammaproteobacteria bacterium]|nr:hypothetical protein [Gammaproteobacteria bacterium]
MAPTFSARCLTFLTILSQSIRMLLADVHAIPSRKQWFYGLLAVCLLVFQTGNFIHDLDIAAHDENSECEICDLFVVSGDDADTILATNAAIVFESASIEFTSLETAIGSGRVNARRIRAPPYPS